MSSEGPPESALTGRETGPRTEGTGRRMLKIAQPGNPPRETHALYNIRGQSTSVI